jgi:hypothetical protein
MWLRIEKKNKKGCCESDEEKKAFTKCTEFLVCRVATNSEFTLKAKLVHT